jgi:cytoskeleton protein RodZ
MSEAGESPAAADGVTAGTLLRQAREASGLHIANLAANLKVPVRKLEALEQDRYDLLPDAVFVRALASSVCRTLKIDAQPVLQRLPQTAQPRLAQDSEGINAPFRTPKDGPTPGWLAQVSKPVVLTVAALLLGALVLIFLPVAQRGGDEAAAQAGNDKSDPVMPPPGAAATVPTAPVAVETPSMTASVNPIAPAASPAANPAALAAAAPEAVAAAATAARASASAPAASPARAAASAPMASAARAPASAPTASTTAAAAPVGAATSPAAAAAAAPANGVVVFRTKGPSWIDVTDARGTTVLRRLMVAGESVGASGALPLSVTVGDAGKTEVQVRGKPYNLAPVSRDNVARFQVN